MTATRLGDGSGMRVLVGIDGSGPSRAALTWALGRAAELDVPVVLVHVIEDEAAYAGAAGSNPAGESSTILDGAARAAALTHPSLEVSSILLTGDPASELAMAAEQQDLLVIGTHKTGYLHGRTIGTRGIVVASIATSTVAVIPESSVAGRNGIVVGVGRNAWHRAVTVGAKEAERTQQRLTLVHASPPSDTTRVPDPARALLSEAAAVATRIAPRVAVRTTVSRRRPTEALLDASRTAALLVLGGSEDSTILSPVIHDVLLNINAPVEIARETVDSGMLQDHG